MSWYSTFRGDSDMVFEILKEIFEAGRSKIEKKKGPPRKVVSMSQW
jgi:hypothetical protein